MSIEADYRGWMARILILLGLLVSSFGMVFMLTCMYHNQLSDRNLLIGAGAATLGGFLLIGSFLI